MDANNRNLSEIVGWFNGGQWRIRRRYNKSEWLHSTFTPRIPAPVCFSLQCHLCVGVFSWNIIATFLVLYSTAFPHYVNTKCNLAIIIIPWNICFNYYCIFSSGVCTQQYAGSHNGFALLKIETTTTQQHLCLNIPLNIWKCFHA